MSRDRLGRPAHAKSRPAAGARHARHNNDSNVRRSLQTHVANRLGEEIVSGLYEPQSRLPNEAEMRARFGVSRTALREAYSMLAAKGLIVARPKIGTLVRPKSDWNMLDPAVLAWHAQTVPHEHFVADLYVLREMVEPRAAAIAASRPASDIIARIAAAYADMERFKDGAGDLIAADLRFHLAILEATGNYFIGALGSLIHLALVSTFKLSWEGAARIRDDRLNQHRLVLEAIREGPPDLAYQRMIELLRDSFGDVRQGLIQRGIEPPSVDPAPPLAERGARSHRGRTPKKATKSSRGAAS